MSDASSDEALTAADEERAAEYDRTAPRCRRCKARAGFSILNGLCQACALAVGVNWKE
jgi:hypothetical protein